MNKRIFFVLLLLPISLVIDSSLYASLESNSGNATEAHVLLENFETDKNKQHAALTLIQSRVNLNFEKPSQIEEAFCSSFSEPDNEHAYQDEALSFAKLDQTFYAPLLPVRWSMSNDKENPVSTYLARLQDKEWCIRSYVVVEYDDFMESTEKDFDEALFAILEKK